MNCFMKLKKRIVGLLVGSMVLTMLAPMSAYAGAECRMYGLDYTNENGNGRLYATDPVREGGRLYAKDPVREGGRLYATDPVRKNGSGRLYAIDPVGENGNGRLYRCK